MNGAGIGIRRGGIKVGKVWKTAMQKTCTVLVDVLYYQPKFGAYVKKTSKLHTHDELEVADVGDLVEIRRCRPRARTKHHELVRILKKVPGMEYKMDTYTHPTNIPLPSYRNPPTRTPMPPEGYLLLNKDGERISPYKHEMASKHKHPVQEAAKKKKAAEEAKAQEEA